MQPIQHKLLTFREAYHMHNLMFLSSFFNGIFVVLVFVMLTLFMYGYAMIFFLSSLILLIVYLKLSIRIEQDDIEKEVKLLDYERMVQQERKYLEEVYKRYN